MTVAVVCHNNMTTVRAAVESVVNQTYPHVEILVVDDCSDDDTRQVLDEILVESPSIKLMSTLTNSGSAGAPRNLAISNATGEYITFLDGDDVLDVNAIYSFASNVYKYDVDIVAGHMIRRQVANGSESGWHKWLFKDAKTLERADEFPDLVYDSTSTNKAYSLEFLRDNALKFPEGVYFEDNQFSANAYSRASGIRLIPDPVYYWLVYPSEQRLTITANWKNTKSYFDRIGAFFVGYHAFGQSHQYDIQAKLVEKTIKHDIWLFIDSAFAASDYSTLVKLWAHAQPVLQTVDSDILRNIPLRQRAKVATLLAGDLEAHNEARSLTSEPSKLKGSIQDDLWVPSNWSVEQSARPELAPYLSVVGDPLGETRLKSNQWRHEVLDISQARSSVSISGTTYDRFGRFDKNEPLDVHLRIRRVGSNVSQPVPGLFNGWNGPSATWSVTVSTLVDQSWLRGTAWRMELVLAQGDIAVVSPLRSKKKVQPKTFVPNDAGILSVIRDQISILTGNDDELILRRRSRESVLGIPGRALSTIARAQRSAVDKTLKRLSTDQKIRLVASVSRKLPLKKNLVLFESHMGKQYSDSPRAISEALREAEPSIRQLWVFDKPNHETRYDGASVVRHSLEYASAISRAAVVVDNQGLPSYYRRRSDQLYFQTWHGTPMKAMGKDSDFKSAAELRAIEESVKNWSVTVRPTEYYKRYLNDAMGYSGKELTIGIPRNDILAQRTDVTDFQYKEVGLRPNSRYVLWAPTFRENGGKGIDRFVDFSSLAESLPEDVIVLVRAHYLQKLSVPSHLSGRVKDVSDVQEVSKLYRIADILVTDYSSVLFDFILTDKPVVIYVPDYSDYRNRQRGLNIDLENEAPGPFVVDQHKLAAAIVHEIDRTPDDRYNAFRMKYSGSGDSSASSRSASYIADWISGGK